VSPPSLVGVEKNNGEQKASLHVGLDVR